MNEIKANVRSLGTIPWYYSCILHIALLVFVSGLMLFPKIINSPLNDWDESRHAINALEMINSGDWVTVTYDHAPDMANIKFPLGAWLIAINYKLFGVNEFSVRLWSVIFTILTTIVIYLWGSLIKNRWLGLLAALIFITSTQVLAAHAGVTGDYDAGASFFVTASLFLFVLFLKLKNGIFLVSSLVAIGLGIIYKSFVPGLFPVFIIAIFLLISGEIKKLDLRTLFIWFVLIIVVIISPWLILRSLSDSSFIFKLLDFDYWQRLTEPVDKHSGSFWFYIAQMGNGFFPWIYFLPIGLFFVLRDSIKDRNEDYLFLLLSLFIIFLTFSIAQTKNFWYILPIYPMMAIIVAIFWSALLKAVSRLMYGRVLLFVLVILLITNVISAVLNARYFFYSQQNRNQFYVFINQESVKKEILSSDLIVHEYIVTQSNLFYLKRLLGDKFTVNSESKCNLKNNQLWLLSSDVGFLRIFMKNCPERRIVDYRIGNLDLVYLLIR